MATTTYGPGMQIDQLALGESLCISFLIVSLLLLSIYTMIPMISRILLAIAASPVYFSTSFQVGSWSRQIMSGNRRLHSSKVSAMPGGLTVTLDKPLGVILEEVEEGAAKGVYIANLKEEGSAFNSDLKDFIIGLALKSVMGTNVRDLKFDGEF